MSTTKHTTIEQLKKLALRTKNEIGLVDAKVTGLTTKVNDLVTAGGEPNKLEGIKVNGTLLALTDKIADILIAEGKTNGTISANGVDQMNGAGSGINIHKIIRLNQRCGVLPHALFFLYIQTFFCVHIRLIRII